tara:strand:+ start:125 stop:619 length:495 start_codon:yes stop_codon:yes gene_type:complete
MMRSGVLYPLVVKGHHTEEIAGSVWRGLPTPTKMEANRKFLSLSQRKKLEKGQGFKSITIAIEERMGLLPTPRAGHHHIESEEAIQKREKRLGRKISRPLGNVLMNLPTPSASMHKYRLKGNTQASKNLEAMARNGTFGKKSRLHPHFVEWMMGFPIGYTDLKH